MTEQAPISDALRATDAESRAVQKTPNRVSLASIEAAIDRIEYHHPEVCPHMTVAFVRMRNGFVVIGQSAPADPGNFNADLGKKYAVENAIRQIWPLEAYALLHRLNAG